MQAGSHKTNGIRKEDVAFMMDPAFLFSCLGARGRKANRKQPGDLAIMEEKSMDYKHTAAEILALSKIVLVREKPKQERRR